MTNIEKMYELAGIEETPQETISQGKFPIRVNYLSYPPFTAEKQLELIKWLAIKYSKYSILHIDKIHVYFRVSFDKDKTKYNTDYELDYIGLGKKFSQALADLICELWEGLTPEQQTEIKRILE